MNRRTSFQLFLFTIIPKNMFSFVFGRITSIIWPKKLGIFINRMFVKVFDIKVEEAEKDIEEYQSLEELFSRRLKKDLRSFTPPICSPCDGALTYSQPITEGQLIQAKGLSYSQKELIFGKSTNNQEQGSSQLSWGLTIYLAPHNYHRVHMPFSGTIESITHIPGQLWPVNDTFTKILPNLFCENERLVFELRHENYGLTYLIMVGAFNVGHLKATDWPDLNTSQFSRTAVKKQTVKISKFKSMGEELGYFTFGSTTILLFDHNFDHTFIEANGSNKREISVGDCLVYN